jgi:prepilin-type processing-associated H-X9-DG protein
VDKKGFTLGELLALILIIGILVAILLPVFDWRREKKHRYACAGNLKQLGIALNMYVKENEDRFPPIDDTKNNFLFDANLLYPEYLTDPTLAMCPGDSRMHPDTTFRLTSDHAVDGTPKGKVHPDCFTGDSYMYLGWMVMDDTETEAFFKAYDDLSPQDYDTDITLPEGSGTLRGDTIHRLHVGVDRFLIVDINVHVQGAEPAATVIALLWDKPHTEPEDSSHRPVGGNVLYLDGHVDYYSLDRDISPMTETMARLLDERPREPISYCDE